ncbi:MAG: B12-binding domain-containing radical SAM protein [Synergistaceae bacterium]|jgi:radical SAM superfamily enzyme YgiQ (UPF0313 family)|nr:B12-binding domain-containing radical SAM protein [Synergistaceae bacterium]
MYELLILNLHRQYDAEPLLSGDWLGVYLLAAFMEENGHPARAFAGYVHEAEALIEREARFGVKVVGLSCDYENQIEVEAVARLVRRRWGFPVIVGGPQAVALGEEFLIRSGADAVVRGEGELPLLALMDFYTEGTGSLADIRGISFMSEGKFVCNPDQPPIANLDALPFPDPKLNIGTWFRRNTASFLTARGCPFRCAFCYEGGNTKTARFRSVENVMEEVRRVLSERPDIRYFLFTDDTFTLDVKRLGRFCEELSSLRRERKFHWFAEAHPETIVKDPGILKVMIEAGLATLQIGIESGSAEVLAAYGKRTTPAMIARTVEMCMEARLPHLVGNIIVGGAFESGETIAASQSFGLSLIETGAGMLELNAINFWPFPGTAMTKCPEKFGLSITDPRSVTSIMDYPVVRSRTLSEEDLSGLRFAMEAAFNDKTMELTHTLPEETALRVFRYGKLGMTSRWFRNLYSVDRLRKFCSLVRDGAARRLADVPPGELRAWHPQRTCTPRVQDGRRFGGDMEIDGELYRALLASSGRQTVSEAAAWCDVSEEAFLRLAEELARRMMLVFCEY